MTTSREKTSNVMGITVSVLLHGIFLAGCLALDAASFSSTPPTDQETTQINKVENQSLAGKVKS